MIVELQAGDTITIPEGCKAIVKDGSVVFEREEKFKEGDILAIADCIKDTHPFIYKRTRDNGFHSFYIGLAAYNELSICDNPNYNWGNGTLRYATEEEKQQLFDKMKEQGLKWNAEEKRVEPIMWRAESGKEYYYVGNQGVLMVDTEDGHIADANRYKFGNYFHTKEQAEEAAKRVNETLRKYHEEIGE